MNDQFYSYNKTDHKKSRHGPSRRNDKSEQDGNDSTKERPTPIFKSAMLYGHEDTEDSDQYNSGGEHQGENRGGNQRSCDEFYADQNIDYGNDQVPHETLPTFTFKGFKELNGPTYQQKETKEINTGNRQVKGPAQSYNAQNKKRDTEEQQPFPILLDFTKH